jgi:RNA polymerase sigma-70 factor (ECF subfamily)
MEGGRASSDSDPEAADEEAAGHDVDAWAEEIADVEEARAGDGAAFARLYRAYGPMVHAILLSRVPDGEVADLVQDVFVTALRRLPELRDVAAFGGWLAAIARNRAVDHRRRRREVVRLDDEAWPARASIPAEAMNVLRTIRRLPDAYRETLVMRLVEGMTGPEIARRTGLTAGSVRVNLHRGMKLLRARLREGGGDA